METWDGENTAFFTPQRAIAEFTAYITREERGRDAVEITENPVQSGADLTDHAFVKPSEVSLQVVLYPTEEETLQDLYSNIIELLRARIPISVSTGKRFYENLLLKEVEQVTDETSENVLALNLVFREIILAPINEIVVKSAKEDGRGKAVQRGQISARKADENEVSILKKLSSLIQ